MCWSPSHFFVCAEQEMGTIRDGGVGPPVQDVPGSASGLQATWLAFTPSLVASGVLTYNSSQN